MPSLLWWKYKWINSVYDEPFIVHCTSINIIIFKLVEHRWPWPILRKPFIKKIIDCGFTISFFLILPVSWQCAVQYTTFHWFQPWQVIKIGEDNKQVGLPKRFFGLSGLKCPLLLYPFINSCQVIFWPLALTKFKFSSRVLVSLPN